jgi:hypothetical protein
MVVRELVMQRRVGHAALEERLSLSKGEKLSYALHHSPGENMDVVVTRGQSMPEPSPQQPHDADGPPPLVLVGTHCASK